MKVSTAKIIVIQEDGSRPARYTDPGKAAEHWARIKAEEWVEKHKDLPQYKPVKTGRWMGSTGANLIHDAGRIRYRKLKRRALRVFRRAMDINS